MHYVPSESMKCAQWDTTQSRLQRTVRTADLTVLMTSQLQYTTLLF